MTDKLSDHFTYPPRALRADHAAAYLSMSTAMLKLVDEGVCLPKPKRLGGMVFWDRAKLDEFVEFFEGDDGDAETGTRSRYWEIPDKLPLGPLDRHFALCISGRIGRAVTPADTGSNMHNFTPGDFAQSSTVPRLASSRSSASVFGRWP
jgi:predicted DNA-binding transcriptional regulator AlpA